MQIVYGVFFTCAAILKLTRHSHMVEEFESMRLPYGLAVLSGLFEIVCGPALIAGVWYPKIAGIAALVMCFVMSGAAIANFKGRDARMGFGVIAIFLLPMVGFVAHGIVSGTFA